MSRAKGEATNDEIPRDTLRGEAEPESFYGVLATLNP